MKTAILFLLFTLSSFVVPKAAFTASSPSIPSPAAYGDAVFYDGADSPYPITEGYAYASDIGYWQPNWMSKISDSKRISELSIPGTHDTMSLLTASGWSAQNQTLPLRTQLDAGIRYLDLRCRHHNDRFSMHHGHVNLNSNLDDVLRTVQQFLDANPSETILVKIMETHTPENNTRSFHETLSWYLSRYPGLTDFSLLANPKLGDIRGKMLFNSQVPTGPEQNDWSIPNSLELYNKWVKIKDHLKLANRSSNHITFKNYLSGYSYTNFPYFVASGNSSPNGPLLLTGLTTPGWASSYPDFPRVSCAGSVCSIAYLGTNRLAARFITEKNLHRIGIVIADFPGRALIDAVIRSNFKLSVSSIPSDAKFFVRNSGSGSCPGTVLKWISNTKFDHRGSGWYGTTLCGANEAPSVVSYLLEGDVQCQSGAQKGGYISSSYVQNWDGGATICYTDAGNYPENVTSYILHNSAECDVGHRVAYIQDNAFNYINETTLNNYGATVCSLRNPN